MRLVSMLAKVAFSALGLVSLFTEPANAAPRAEDCRAVFIRLSGPTSAKPGETVRYRIRVKNEGDCEIKNAVVTNFLPRESRFVSAYPEPSSQPQQSAEPRLPVAKVEWKGVPITSSEFGEYFDVKVTVTGTPGRVITNTGCVEHSKIGRLCDTYDTYVKTQATEGPSTDENDGED